MSFCFESLKNQRVHQISDEAVCSKGAQQGQQAVFTAHKCSWRQCQTVTIQPGSTEAASVCGGGGVAAGRVRSKHFETLTLNGEQRANGCVFGTKTQIFCTLVQIISTMVTKRPIRGSCCRVEISSARWRGDESIPARVIGRGKRPDARKRGALHSDCGAKIFFIRPHGRSFSGAQHSEAHEPPLRWR